MHLGQGVKPEKADRIIRRGDLASGEVAWFYANCSNVWPSIDAIVVTNARMLGLSSTQGVKYEAPLNQITTTQCEPRKGTVHVATTDGRTMTFKSVDPEDVLALRHYLDVRADPADEAATDGLEASGATSALIQDLPTTRSDARAAKRELKAREKERQAREKADRQASDREMVGDQIASETFGINSVSIFANGYVRVGLALFSGKAPYERLLAIEASSDVSKKSALGRGAGAVVTMGFNLASSNKRGDVYLTIVTDRTTHVLHEEPPTAANLKASKKLEAAGAAVIRARDASAAEQRLVGSGAAAVDGQGPQATDTPVVRSASDKLRELAIMHKEGLVSDEEFQALRAKLIESF